MLIIRPVIKDDLTILRLATLYNLNWETDRFSFSDIDSNPKFNHYYNTWNSEDFGFILQKHQQVLGDVWLKFFKENDPSFAFWGEDTPELSVSIFPEYRNLGFGAKLLKLAIEEATKREVPTISLSVEFENTIARNLYEKFGFKYVEDTDGLMILNFL